jgi:hypothetical protein
MYLYVCGFLIRFYICPASFLIAGHQYTILSPHLLRNNSLLEIRIKLILRIVYTT